ncbi:MAG: hypothetical protein KAQ94_03820 [Arcobacteraceae bacterium]|nr:hypothetical protein [Arcobacteraceae bacterium]
MIKKERYIKNTLLSAVLVILIIFGVAISFYQYNLIQNDIKSDIKIQNNYVHKTFDLFLNKLKQDVILKSDFFLSAKGVKKAFNEKNREKLYSLVENIYKRMAEQNKYLKIMTFRLNDGSTFLRVHKPHMFGDKLNKKRKIILDTISTQKRQYGFEVGKLKMTYRVVTPIFYDKKLIGIVEVGVEPEYITENINKLFEIRTALLIKKEDKTISLDKSKMQRLNGFVLARGDELFKKTLKDINLKQSSNTIMYKNNEYLIHTMLNLNNHKDKVAAKVLLAYNMKIHNEKLNYLIKNNLLITALMLIILFVILNIGLNYFMRKIEKSHRDIIEKDNVMAQHSKMAAMGEMLESIAHQWRQPLSVITTSATGVKMQKELGVLEDKLLVDSCVSITNSANHLSQTIDDFRNFFKHNKEKSFFNLKDTFHSTFNLVSSKFEIQDIEIIENIDDIEIFGFENELIQVFMNILNNARDELEIKDIKGVIFIDIYEQNDNAIIKIKDNAGGISNEILPKIFGAYFTTKEDNDGTGIGLYMSRKIIVDNFNGTIEAKNKEFEYEGINYTGVEFKIKLPLNIELIR